MQVAKCYFDDGFYDTNIYMYGNLTYGHTISGPSIIIDDNRYVCSHVRIIPTARNISRYFVANTIRVSVLCSTILIEPQCVATITKHGDVCIKVCMHVQIVLHACSMHV